MKDILKYYVSLFSNATQSLKKKAIFIEKPWALIDDDGEIQKLIFKKDGGLVLSKNGKVIEGKWEYFPEAKSLLVDRGHDKLLLNEQFIDENVLILKKDGTDNDFFGLANENTLRDYNIPKYLNNLKKVQLNMGEVVLLSGNKLQVQNARELTNLEFIVGRKADIIDENFNPLPIKEGVFMSQDKKFTYYVENGTIGNVFKNSFETSVDGIRFEVEGGFNKEKQYLIKRRITLNGMPVEMDRIVTEDNVVYFLKESVIYNIVFLKTYLLSQGYTVKVEQKNENSISKGDRIILSEPFFPIPDGRYKIKGKLFSSVTIKESFIV